MRIIGNRILVLALASALCVVLAPAAHANVIGTIPVLPGQTVFPGVVPPGAPPGTLLASMVQPFAFTTTAGTTSGTLDSAVFLESGGTLDFYYQVNNNAVSASGIARETDTSFAGFLTFVGFRIDGSTLPGGIFVNGTVPPVTADRSLGLGSTVGFNFNPPITSEIMPGTSSNVLVISTDALRFGTGNASVIDGGSATVLVFEPQLSRVPEPASLLLLGGGFLSLAGTRRLRLRK